MTVAASVSQCPVFRLVHSIPSFVECCPICHSPYTGWGGWDLVIDDEGRAFLLCHKLVALTREES